MKSKPIPFYFIVEALYELDPVIKPFFGMYSIYIREKLMLILRDRKQDPHLNGLWIAANLNHHNSLMKELPTLKILTPRSKSSGSGWLILPDQSTDFEHEANKICDLILKKDNRIGKY
jgi:hypothetical protein